MVRRQVETVPFAKTKSGFPPPFDALLGSGRQNLQGRKEQALHLFIRHPAVTDFHDFPFFPFNESPPAQLLASRRNDGFNKAWKTCLQVSKS
jgi:hypothetical protein